MMDYSGRILTVSDRNSVVAAMLIQMTVPVSVRPLMHATVTGEKAV